MRPSSISRRRFLQSSLSAALAHTLEQSFAADKTDTRSILTVNGPIKTDAFGITLPHEHIICDFIGTENTGKHRWNQEQVFDRMLPYVEALDRSGVSTFIDCTPAFIGRDPEILRKLSISTGLNIVTNTGFYGGADDKYVPKDAYSMSEKTMADLWLKEFEQGIEGNRYSSRFHQNRG